MVVGADALRCMVVIKKKYCTPCARECSHLKRNHTALECNKDKLILLSSEFGKAIGGVCVCAGRKFPSEARLF